MYSITTEFCEESECIDNKNFDDMINLKLKPRLEDLELKIKELKNDFKNNTYKNILGTGIALSTQCVGVPLHVTIAGFRGYMLLEYSKYQNSLRVNLSNSKNKGLSLLLHLDKEYCK